MNVLSDFRVYIYILKSLDVVKKINLKNRTFIPPKKLFN